MRTLNSIELGLSGINLIEASAGTGKTFTIASLYLRLIVENGLMPENILVVTYTEAATKELRERVRRRLCDARAAVTGRNEDSFLSLLTDPSVNRRWPVESVALERIDSALRSFDSAAISTIHGFCYRSLQENAFASGSLYDTEIMSNQAQIIGEAVDDFWRIRFFGDPAPLLPLVEREKLTPEKLSAFFKGKLGDPELEVVPSFSDAEAAALEDECCARYREICSQWNTVREEIATLLLEHKGLSRNARHYRKEDAAQEILDGIERFTAGGNPYAVFAGFEKLTPEYMLRNRLKTDPPEHQFFGLCGKMQEAVSRRIVLLYRDAYDFVRIRIPEIKERLNVRFYDDLLVDMHRALKGDQGRVLAERIRGKYRAALIDEFQDTDQMQYLIFRAIFSGDETPLFLIGDPKQAIYSFRGADIFAYLEAKGDVPPENRFTMESNWRSTPGLVRSVNTIFRQRSARPFVIEGLEYPEVSAARVKAPIRLDSRDSAPLQLWFMAREEGETAHIDIGTANERIIAALGEEISGLLADGRALKTCIGDNPVQPEHVAVIVRSHKQANMVHLELTARGIPSVVRSEQSVFSTQEACDLCTILSAVAEPSNENRIRAALVNPVLGAGANDIASYLEDDQAWELRLESFRFYHELWRDRGFMVMFRSFLSKEGVRRRLISNRYGERRLTNLLHLAELIHGESVSRRHGIDSLVAWFREKAANPPEGKDHEIRLESDDCAVKIVTVHVSKGLEYPIVFCPFSWGGVHSDAKTVICHEGYRRIADFGSDSMELHRKAAIREMLAENLRLLYVSLTRAEYRCYLVWGRFRNTEGSALAYLLHSPENPEDGDPVAATMSAMEGISDKTLIERIMRIEQQEPGLVTVSVNPSPVPALYKADKGDGIADCRHFSRILDRSWAVASFTSFADGHRETAELPDYDQGASAEAFSADSTAPPGSIFAFPKGARAGTFLHGVLEKINFAAPNLDAIRSRVGHEAEDAGFGAGWENSLSAMVSDVLEAPLGADGTDFTLSMLENGGWLTELEFFFPLRFINSRRVADILSGWGEGYAAVDLQKVAKGLAFTEVHGMVRGFIDLVCRHEGRHYIIDWKSNHLGNRIENYGKESLSREMIRHLYPLQYLLYTVAVNRFLELRQPGYRYEEHFGGVRYIFLRGLDASSTGCGVFSDLPPAGLVRDLTSCLVDARGV